MEQLRKEHEARIQELKMKADADKQAAVGASEQAAAAKLVEEQKAAAAVRDELAAKHGKEVADKEALHSKEQALAQQAAEKAMDVEKERAAAKLAGEQVILHSYQYLFFDVCVGRFWPMCNPLLTADMTLLTVAYGGGAQVERGGT